MDPYSTLKALAKDLIPGGLTYIEVPDAIAFDRLPADDDIFNSCHLWMFDPKSITFLLNSAGFELLYLRQTRAVRGHFALMTISKLAA